ncbi:Hsp20/alpha crystallin family protein [Halomonas heilongjiangensis]|uniref:Heat-shock protein Hsp20 n=1 Tax=Halomonas heilongjiangensis TaxID=1387883 RepID=A0A2N7TLU7_9GAMM|nr:Hsp20/alpha crystallin family protein [Halomonas heilongjiangensis]PMR69157.1 heat-shock protein Hsp20 [Halomonas heilongjiangensis]PXX94183.1 heat-shock protein Hsp20 [Halomonas heilongjiangensis]
MFDDLRRFDTGPFQGVDWFRQLMDEFFTEGGAADIRAVPRGSYPMINVGRTDDAVRVYVFAAGLSAGDLEVSIQDNVLTVSGKREAVVPETEGEERRTDFRRERYRGAFSRSLALPDGLDVERAEARFRHGVCEVLLPKREELKPRRIEIRAA